MCLVAGPQCLSDHAKVSISVEKEKSNTDDIAGEIKDICDMCFCDVKDRPIITVVFKALLKVISGSH